MNINRTLAAGLAGVLYALIASFAAPAQAADSFMDAFKLGKGGLAFRYRLENVDQDNFDKDATASTLRARVNFRTDDLHGFSLFGEADYVITLGWNDYNAGAGNTPDRVEYPVIADPTGGDLNQAYIQWKNSRIGLGRSGVGFMP